MTNNKMVKKIINFLYLSGFIILCTFLIIIGVISNKDKQKNDLTKVNLIVEEAGSPANNYTWTGHFNQNVNKAQLMYYSYFSKVMIKKNGSIVSSHGYRNTRIGKTSGAEWVCYTPADFNMTDVIQIHIEPVYGVNSDVQAELLLDNIYCGDRLSLVRHIFRSNFGKNLLSVITILSGLFMVIVITTLKMVNLEIPKDYRLYGAIIILGSICIFIGNNCLSLLFQNVFFLTTFSIVLELIIIELLLLFMRFVLIRRKLKLVADICLVIWSGGIITYFILQTYNIYDGFELIKYYLGTAITMMVIEITLITVEYIHNKNSNIARVLWSGIGICFFTFIALVHYFIFRRYVIETFQIGLLIFTFVQLSMMIKYIKDGMQQIKRSNEMEKELVNSRISIMISQIQPHFLYNSLGSISQLCVENPVKAGAALDRFADFLRGNMKSLTCTEAIPFIQEFKHLENYIELEKIRFEDRIKVVYDIQYEDFNIPALTLQPIVENSIKHGITKKRNGGTVTISTFKRRNQAVIIINDDGIGFDVQEINNDGTTHIGLKNVKTRISQLCDGTLNVCSKPGEGTTVTIVVWCS